MPKVSQRYRDERRAQILSAAKRCFLRDGFHETSMQDVFGEAGLSSGAVYRYFTGKEDMILSIAEENMREIIALIDTLASDPQPDGLGEAVASVLALISDKNNHDSLGALAVLVWSEALRNAALAQRFDTAMSRMRSSLAEVVRDHQAKGSLPSQASADDIAGLLMTIIPGFVLNLAMFGDAAARGIPDAARALWPAQL